MVSSTVTPAPDFDSELDRTFGSYDPDPSSWGPLVDSAAKRWNVPAPLLHAVMGVESSGGRNQQDSSKGAQGGAQLMPGTQTELNVDDPHDPRQFIPAMAQYLAQGKAKLGNWTGALRYYQGGPDQSKWGPENEAYPGLVAGKLLKAGLDPKQVLGQSNAPVAGGQNAPQATFDELIEHEFGNGLAPPEPSPSPSPSIVPSSVPASTPAPSPTPASAPTLAPGWGALANTVNAATLGALPYLGGGAAAGQSLAQLESGMPIGATPMGQPGGPQAAMHGITQSLEGARNAWQGANPLTNLLTQLLGATPSTMLGVSALGGITKAGAQFAGALAPELNSVLGALTKLLGGSAGAEGGLTSLPLRLASRATSGAVEGATSAALQQGLTDEPQAQNVKTGAMVGAGLRTVLGPLGGAVNKLLNPSVSDPLAQLGLSPAAAQVGLRGGQIAQGQTIKFFDKLLGSHSNDEQVQHFTEGVAPLAGVVGKELTPETLQSAREAIGQNLSTIAQRLGITTDSKLLDDLDAVGKTLKASLFTDEARFGPVAKVLDNVETDALVGLKGEDYARLTQFRGVLGGLQQSKDPQIRLFAGDIRDALDGALERTAQASGNPQDIAALKAARTQYKNNLLLEPLVDKSVSGVIDPKGLLAQVSKKYPKLAEAGEIGDYAQVGQLLAKPTTQGDTTTPTNIHRLRNELLRWGGLAGAYELYHEGLPPHILIPAAGALALGGAGAKALQKTLTGPEFRNRLSQMALGQRGPAQIPSVAIPAVNQFYNLPDRSASQ